MDNKDSGKSESGDEGSLDEEGEGDKSIKDENPKKEEKNKEENEEDKENKEENKEENEENEENEEKKIIETKESKIIIIDSTNKIDLNQNEINEENINNEEENQKLSLMINDNIKKMKKPIEKCDTLKITGDEEVKTNFHNNAYYLGNLFMDIVNKYDGEKDLKEKRQLLRSTISRKKKVKRTEIILVLI